MCIRDSISIRELDWETDGSVSYTHLDVYKRQMDGSLNQPSRVQDEGPMDCKLLLAEKKSILLRVSDGICGISTG